MVFQELLCLEMGGEETFSYVYLKTINLEMRSSKKSRQHCSVQIYIRRRITRKTFYLSTEIIVPRKHWHKSEFPIYCFQTLFEWLRVEARGPSCCRCKGSLITWRHKLLSPQQNGKSTISSEQKLSKFFFNFFRIKKNDFSKSHDSEKVRRIKLDWLSRR